MKDTLSPVAYYIGSQETDHAPIALFNLLIDLPAHPIESTVSAQTLRAHGYYVPCNPLVGERVTAILRVSHNKSCA